MTGSNDDFFEYELAREMFITAAEAAGFRHMRMRIPADDTPDLYQDYALLRRDPKRFLIHVAGTHGVEGYVGSRVQRELLAVPQGSDGPSLLFIHPINPYGMKFYRRANSQNVDLNRNFRPGPAQPNPDYRFFNLYLNPTSRWQFPAGLLSGWFQYKRLGKGRSTQAVAQGQVEFPGGAFYMGHHLQREVHQLQEFLKAHVAGAEKVTVIDVHSGLGGFGEELLFVDADGNPATPAYFQRIFGRPVTFSDPAKGLYKNQGPLWDAFRHSLPGADLHYVLQEFGAREFTTTLNALREENCEWQRRPRGAMPSLRVRGLMLNAFCPGEPEWWANVQEKAQLRWRQALAELEKG